MGGQENLETIKPGDRVWIAAHPDHDGPATVVSVRQLIGVNDCTVLTDEGALVEHVSESALSALELEVRWEIAKRRGRGPRNT